MKTIFTLQVITMVFLSFTNLSAQLSFTNTGQTFGSGTINNMVFADINADGFPDAIVAKGEWNVSQKNELWINNGEGNFTLSGQNLGSDGIASFFLMMA
jgi:hypothetical protein